MEKTITTAKEFNATAYNTNFRFQNADGSLKKTGFVVSWDGVHQWFKTLAQAELAEKPEVTEMTYDFNS